ncbi:class I SAM-dependent methyltransferase [Plantactinospora sp. S1510]|uniref:Class I SAM-dependent methyltransferase n=1 Tax=Plantactinospora alkalitolerans TaxID=2789879 RepID=A0ABS0H061_9ACTN|nr:class I SAM-dependent methyltransferase [Plantactinospora alkalitolerans]MBF9131729.1 class I SAM-dependent methyltransferase [Plantactinospora alkalitolerans]
MSTTHTKRLPMLAMEGAMARWYARTRGSASQLDIYRKQATSFTDSLPQDVEILEIAPGPGYFAVELARRGFRVTGLDISHSFVEIAARHARREGVTADFRHGDVAAQPFPDGSFDVIVCQAAFKNFREPVKALNEMRRVLRPGGVALIQDMNRDASTADIGVEVSRMGLSRRDALLTRLALRGLRRRAYSAERFRRLAAASDFTTCTIGADGIGLEVRLTRTS